MVMMMLGLSRRLSFSGEFFEVSESSLSLSLCMVSEWGREKNKKGRDGNVKIY